MQIVAVPEGMSKGGKGPLLACNNIDLDILWGRLGTIEELAKSMRETIRVEVHGCVERGLLITLFGIRGFVPISHVKKEEGQEWLAKSDLEVPAPASLALSPSIQPLHVCSPLHLMECMVMSKPGSPVHML